MRHQASAFATGHAYQRYLYSPQMIEEINLGQRYQILSNNAQTEIYVVDTQYDQRVGRFYDISYALIVADSLNQESHPTEGE